MELSGLFSVSMSMITTYMQRENKQAKTQSPLLPTSLVVPGHILHMSEV